jgi:hypothetical protein
VGKAFSGYGAAYEEKGGEVEEDQDELSDMAGRVRARSSIRNELKPPDFIRQYRGEPYIIFKLEIAILQ